MKQTARPVPQRQKYTAASKPKRKKANWSIFTPIQTKFPYKSGIIVINYDGGYMDVFLNGVLVASKPNIAPYIQYDDVVVGENKGLEGGIRSRHITIAFLRAAKSRWNTSCSEMRDVRFRQPTK